MANLGLQSLILYKNGESISLPYAANTGDGLLASCTILNGSSSTYYVGVTWTSTGTPTNKKQVAAHATGVVTCSMTLPAGDFNGYIYIWRSINGTTWAQDNTYPVFVTNYSNLAEKIAMGLSFGSLNHCPGDTVSYSMSIQNQSQLTLVLGASDNTGSNPSPGSHAATVAPGVTKNFYLTFIARFAMPYPLTSTYLFYASYALPSSPGIFSLGKTLDRTLTNAVESPGHITLGTITAPVSVPVGTAIYPAAYVSNTAGTWQNAGISWAGSSEPDAFSVLGGVGEGNSSLSLTMNTPSYMPAGVYSYTWGIQAWEQDWITGEWRTVGGVSYFTVNNSSYVFVQPTAKITSSNLPTSALPGTKITPTFSVYNNSNNAGYCCLDWWGVHFPDSIGSETSYVGYQTRQFSLPEFTMGNNAVVITVSALSTATNPDINGVYQWRVDDTITYTIAGIALEPKATWIDSIPRAGSTAAPGEPITIGAHIKNTGTADGYFGVRVGDYGIHEGFFIAKNMEGDVYDAYNISMPAEAFTFTIQLYHSSIPAPYSWVPDGLPHDLTIQLGASASPHAIIDSYSYTPNPTTYLKPGDLITVTAILKNTGQISGYLRSNITPYTGSSPQIEYYSPESPGLIAPLATYTAVCSFPCPTPVGNNSKISFRIYGQSQSEVIAWGHDDYEDVEINVGGFEPPNPEAAIVPPIAGPAFAAVGEAILLVVKLKNTGTAVGDLGVGLLSTTPQQNQTGVALLETKDFTFSFTQVAGGLSGTFYAFHKDLFLLNHLWVLDTQLAFYVPITGGGPPVPIPGCMDPTATNYNPAATYNDESCQYAPTPEPPAGVGGNFQPVLEYLDGGTWIKESGAYAFNYTDDVQANGKSVSINLPSNVHTRDIHYPLFRKIRMYDKATGKIFFYGKVQECKSSSTELSVLAYDGMKELTTVYPPQSNAYQFAIDRSSAIGNNLAPLGLLSRAYADLPTQGIAGFDGDGLGFDESEVYSGRDTAKFDAACDNRYSDPLVNPNWDQVRTLVKKWMQSGLLNKDRIHAAWRELHPDSLWSDTDDRLIWDNWGKLFAPINAGTGVCPWEPSVLNSKQYIDLLYDNFWVNPTNGYTVPLISLNYPAEGKGGSTYYYIKKLAEEDPFGTVGGGSRQTAADTSRSAGFDFYVEYKTSADPQHFYYFKRGTRPRYTTTGTYNPEMFLQVILNGGYGPYTRPMLSDYNFPKENTTLATRVIVRYQVVQDSIGPTYTWGTETVVDTALETQVGHKVTLVIDRADIVEPLGSETSQRAIDFAHITLERSKHLTARRGSFTFVGSPIYTPYVLHAYYPPILLRASWLMSVSLPSDIKTRLGITSDTMYLSKLSFSWPRMQCYCDVLCDVGQGSVITPSVTGSITNIAAQTTAVREGTTSIKVIT